MNFADQLDDISNELVQLSSKCQAKASEIRNKVQLVQKQTEDKVQAGAAEMEYPNEDESAKADTKFTYGKTNSIIAGKFMCTLCSKSFRSNSDLCNHKGQHTKQFYHCLQCTKVFRSV